MGEVVYRSLVSQSKDLGFNSFQNGEPLKVLSREMSWSDLHFKI